jgi:hypothetical protein
MFCTNCGAPNKGDAKFCANCDESLIDVQVVESLTRARVLSHASNPQQVHFLRALFDFSFHQSVSLRITKFLFGLSILAACLIAALFVIVGFHVSWVLGIVALFIGVPLIILSTVMYTRVLLEMMLGIFRISDRMTHAEMASPEEKSQSGDRSADSIQWNV